MMTPHGKNLVSTIPAIERQITQKEYAHPDLIIPEKFYLLLPPMMIDAIIDHYFEYSGCNYLVPLFEKEGLGEIVYINPPQFPFFKGGGEYLQIFHFLLLEYDCNVTVIKKIYSGLMYTLS
jgi:hypothetical protein